MNKKQYFYLVAGLPGLSFQDEHLPFSARTFLDDLKDKIDKKDLQLACMLYYKRDNQNLLNLLFNKKDKQQLGCYSQLELKKGIEGNFLLPRYMTDFIYLFKEKKSNDSVSEWEVTLTEAYFNEVMKCGNDFLSEWTEFELNLKNILLLLGNRKQSLPFSDFIIEVNEVAAMIKEDPSTDFGAQPSIDFMNAAVKVMDDENLVEREKRVDLLRWKKVEEMSFFHYFTIEAILSFIIRLMILERWIMLKQEKGESILPSILNSLTEEIKIPTIEHS